MEPWYTSDLSIACRFHWQKVLWKAHLDVNNVLGQDYEVIVNYPMPGRNYTITLSVEI